jgi:hypothetical protein
MDKFAKGVPELIAYCRPWVILLMMKNFLKNFI